MRWTALAGVVGVALGSLLATTALAPEAAADELYATVERTVAPGERAVVRVRSDVAGPVQVLLFRVEDPAPFLAESTLEGPDLHARLDASLARALEASVGKATPRVVPRRPAGAAPLPPFDARLTFVSLSTADLAAGPDGTFSREVGVALPASGLYAVEVRRGTMSALATALCSRIALVVKRDPGQVVAWAVDRTSGRPIGNVVVDAVPSGGPSAGGSGGVRPATLGSATTGADGIARIPVRGTPTLDVRARLGDDLAFGDETYHPAGSSDRRVHAFPHQPAYRPGERVEVKGVVRSVKDGAYALDPEAKEATLRFLAPGGKEMGVATAAVSADLGTFAAGFDLAKDAPVGAWTLRAEVRGKAYAAPFRVEEYRTPSFEVTVTADPSRVFAGGAVAFDVAAALYEGGPVAGGAVRWTASFVRVDRDLFPTDELARLFSASEREAYAPVPVAAGETRLDAAGKARVTVTAPETKEDGWLALRATVVGPDRTAVGASGGAAVAAAPVTIALKTDRHLYGPEATARASVVAVLADGKPAADREGVLLVSRAGAGPVGGAEERLVATLPFRTDARGTAALDVVFSANGLHTVSASMPRLPGEPAGPPAHAQVRAWVAGEHADVGVSGDRTEIVADRDSYRVGDVARLLVLSPVGARPFLWTVEGARVGEARVVDLGGPADRGAGTVVEVKIASEHAPALYVGACVVDAGNAMAAVKMLRVPPVERLLKVEVAAPAPVIEPGATAALTVKVTDASGKPAAGAEVSVAVVDDALFALWPDPAASYESFFHPVPRNDVRTGGPLQHASVGWGSPPRGSSKAALAEESEGAGPLSPEAPAPMPTPSPAAPAPGGGGGFAGPPPARAAVPGGPPPPVGEPAADPASRGDDDAGAERLRAGVEKKEGKRDGGEGPLEARADFRTAVAWFPAVRTGPDGTASLGDVRFAQSLTRWRVTARAVDAATRVGTATSTLRTAKRVTARVTLPRFLRATDLVEAPFLVHNLSEEDTVARFKVFAEHVRLESAGEGEATLAPGALLTRDLRVSAPGVGAGAVVAEVRSEQGSDAVRIVLPVLPQGIPKTLAASGWTKDGVATLPALTLPRTAEPGTRRLTVSVAPTWAHAVGAALPYLVDYPYGCTEQTMSRLLPAIVAKTATDAFKIPPRGRLAELPKVLEAGVARLRTLQHADGGFGWWEHDASDLQMTAYVLHGLSRASRAMADPASAKAMTDRAAAWLLGRLGAPREGESDAAHAFALMALADAGAKVPAKAVPPVVGDGVAVLPPLSRAFLVRAMVAMGRAEDAKGHLRELLGHVVREGDGLHFGSASTIEDRLRPGASRWADDPVETTAWALGAVAMVDPKHEVLVPGARWLLAQRTDGARWKSTRDTAACVAFLTRLAVAEGELGGSRTTTVSVNGVVVGSVSTTAENAFTDEGTLEVPASALPPEGAHEVRATTAGGDAIVSAALSFTETGPAIDEASAGFTVRRTWNLLETETRADGQVVHVAKPWTESVPSGALVEAEVVVESAEAREFVMVVSPHPAGFEPERRFFEEARRSLVAPAKTDHVETRDDRTVFFAKSLPAGKYVFRHVMRATHVGAFTALPAQAELMYFPTVRGNSRGEVIEVRRPAPEAGGKGAR